MMNADEIKAKIRMGEYFFSRHAASERAYDELAVFQGKEAILNGEILEQYPDTGRGESCLVMGFSGLIPIHAICGWARNHQVVIVTVYIPSPPRFIDPWTRGA